MKKRLVLTTALLALCTITSVSAATRSYTYAQMTINGYTATCSLSRGDGHATATTSKGTVLESKTHVEGYFADGAYHSANSNWNKTSVDKVRTEGSGTPINVTGNHEIRGYGEEKSVGTYI
ncbi:hypothetical protein [Holdemania massiliensis]|uniref:hypothetical protein n=1 Tax=Holdemania massiliensis TaxID=1468449 RepID=UPI001F05B43F|nr:hypothetical protein [Holdemania massiliensis]MCH1941819.1 hypothetical protein [Holdemania massiliensis]